jgi:phage-related protein
MYQDLQKSNLNAAIVELFTLDASTLGQGIFYFTNQTNPNGTSVVYNGITYAPIPVSGEGWAKSLNGAAPRPILTVDNTSRYMQAAVIAAGDLAGATLTRQRVISTYLDAVNFPRRNLLNWSEQFDNAAYTKAVNVTITPNSVTAPDGNTTADTLAVSVAGPGFYNVAPTAIALTSYTASIYAKAGTTSLLNFELTNQNESNVVVYQFNLATGGPPSAGTLSGFTAASAAITDVGSGWYRCSITGTTAATGTTNVGIYPRLPNIGNVYVWGAQLEQSVPQVNSPNLLTYPEAFDANAVWGRVASTVTPNVATAPDGTLSGDKWVEDSSTSIRYAQNTSFTLVSNGVHTVSVYAKAAERSIFALEVLGYHGVYVGSAGFDLSAGTSTFNPRITATSNISKSITSVGNGWYRCSLTCTMDSSVSPTTSPRVQPLFDINGTYANYAGTVGSGIYIWGFQLEAGTAPTPYINQTTIYANSASTYQQTTTTHYFTSDPAAVLSTDKFIVDRKTGHNNKQIQWELCWAMDRPGFRVPSRQVLRDYGFPGVGMNSGR